MSLFDSFNKVVLVGRAGADIELKYTRNNKVYCELRLAVDDSYRNETEQKDVTIWVECKAWGKTAELLDQYITKGQLVLVEGSLKMDQWEDRDTGKRRSKLYIMLQSFTKLGKDGQPSRQRSDDMPYDNARKEHEVPF